MSSSGRNRHQSIRCRLCGQAIGTAPLSLGRLPVCNGFSKSAAADRLVDLDIVECEICRLIQLCEAPAAETLMPRLPWIRYREPEGHLDTLVGELLALRPEARSALGTGPFEHPLLSRLATRGLQTQALALDITATAEGTPYLESWQATLVETHLANEATQVGTADIVSCRYIVEHSPEPVGALRALKRLLNPEGLLLIEVPDSSKFLAAHDYCFLWEEHSCYFVEETLRRLGEAAGYNILSVLRYPGALEDALVAVLKVAETSPAVQPPPAQGQSRLFQAYRDGFATTRELLQARLTQAAGPERHRIALFGVGHQAIMFVNAFGLAADIALAVDDDPDKAGFFPPGFHSRVVGSDRLLQDGRIQTCLFAVSPHIQARVREKLAPLAARGVQFHSIYAALDDSILKELAP
jgi:hypothetical protein